MEIRWLGDNCTANPPARGGWPLASAQAESHHPLRGLIAHSSDPIINLIVLINYSRGKRRLALMLRWNGLRPSLCISHSEILMD